MKLITSQINVDTWDEHVWEVVLNGTNIIVSTYQVLLDALTHAFISMSRLSLLVFDEAHNCIGKNPGQKVMMDHYRPSKLARRSVPAILGLTATPSIRSNVQDLEKLETSMDARCISPTIHRDELLKCVRRPRLKYITYVPGDLVSTSTMRSLHDVFRNMDIRQDPYILKLRANLTERNKRELAQAITKNNTYSQDQMRKLCSRSMELCRQLGTWAADLYIAKVVENLLGRIDGGDDFFDKFINEEKKYLANTLRQVVVEPTPDVPRQAKDLSDKVRLLMQELLSADPSVMGIIFVQERVMVSMLLEVLRSNEAIRERYRIGTMVGTSNNSNRKKDLYDVPGNADIKSLEEFRFERLNLLIATSVLEEGIDVRACNLVICFDSPLTPKSFIQRRGRARMTDSQLVLFAESAPRKVSDWESLELEMKQLYEDQEREIRRLERIEDSEGSSEMYYIVPASGARLDFDNAKSHLDHFCSVLSKHEYVDSRPDYIITRVADTTPAMLSAAVLLPSFVPASLRRAESSRPWLSEKNATKDAAFQAYVALHRAGLVNDHLLPLKLEEPAGIEGRAAELTVEPQLNPWVAAAPAWMDPADKWRYSLSCVDGFGQPMGNFEIVLPVWLNRPRPITMFMDRNSRWELRISEGMPLLHVDLNSIPDHTSTLLALHFAHRWPVDHQRNHVIRVFAPNTVLSMDQIGAGALDPDSEDIKQGRYLIRDPRSNFSPFLYQNLIPSKPLISDVKKRWDFDWDNAPSDVPYLSLSPWTKRTDFLHPMIGDASKEMPSSKQYAAVLPLTWATVDTISVRYTQFGMLIPSLLHKLEVMLVAKELAKTLLEPVEISNLDLVLEAICAPGAGEPVCYEKLEFLGDSILKFCTSILALSQSEWPSFFSPFTGYGLDKETDSHTDPDFPEGYLSQYRDRLVANSRLSRANIEKGLAKFIITRSFTGHRWRPLYLDTYLPGGDFAAEADRKISTKTLADVVEALIGAAYLDGHLPKALKCITVFLGEDCNWSSVLRGHETLFNMASDKEALPAVLAPLEQLVGYAFRRKALLIEAVTHASYIADTGNRSYERLEFLGDAVLDYIIVTRVFESNPRMPHYEMHTLKTAMVNGDFIAFMTMEHGLRTTDSVVEADAATGKARISSEDSCTYLWKFMRHALLSIGLEQKETVGRHRNTRESILRVMTTGGHYPWDLLAHLQAKKFYSDLFEALLGAVWIDSGGSIDVCRAVVARFGILDYLDRILRDGVCCLHPKERLNRLTSSESITYQVDVRERSTGEREFVCAVTVGERLVVTVDDGLNREEVQTKAAHAAVEVLMAERASR
ncbi:Dicer-like protein 2 [Escovopsis weberi]|uniref:Dicer-like protein 2 n=1 Tax=Escovopsis weberi TaxID=150374 RepID=A0A0M8MTM5_ESCWE|nr:Dicer-like protein 2 [Escovopsis weberi]